MTHQQILEKAIQKAIDGGWERTAPMTVVDEGDTVIVGELDSKYKHYADKNEIIFNHDFAKALWGQEPVVVTLKQTNGKIEATDGKRLWRHHLQQMVIADDPIKYLGDNI
jgi:hypothetical protein